MRLYVSVTYIKNTNDFMIAFQKILGYNKSEKVMQAFSQKKRLRIYLKNNLGG